MNRNTEMYPLHAAAGRGDLAACAALLEGGAEPNALSAEGRTPLHHAVEAKNLDVCECLMRSGAQFAYAPENRAADYLTPFQYALELNWRDGVRFFLATQGGDPCAARIWQRS